MLSRVKCPACGVNNARERMACIECGATLDLGQATERLTDEPTEPMREEAVPRFKERESRYLVYQTTFGGRKSF